MTTHEPLYIDNSTLKAEARCSTEVMLRYAWDWTTPEDRAALRAGTAYHALAEAHFKGAGASDALGAFDASYREFAEANVADTDRLAYGNLRRICARWLALHPLAKLPFAVTPDFVEVGFAFPLDDSGDFILCGRLDGLPTYEGARWVLEHKSTGRITPDWLDGFSLDSQLTGYIWAAQQHTGVPIAGAFLNAIEFSKLPGGPTPTGAAPRKCPEHKVSFAECGDLHMTSRIVMVTRTPEAIEEWRKTALHLARRYRDRLRNWPTLDMLHRIRMTGTFNNSCRFCTFKQFCKLGRPAQYIADGNLVQEPWRPYERVTLTNDPTGKS